MGKIQPRISNYQVFIEKEKWALKERKVTFYYCLVMLPFLLSGGVIALVFPLPLSIQIIALSIIGFTTRSIVKFIMISKIINNNEKNQ